MEISCSLTQKCVWEGERLVGILMMEIGVFRYKDDIFRSIWFARVRERRPCGKPDILAHLSSGAREEQFEIISVWAQCDTSDFDCNLLHAQTHWMVNS